MSSNVPIVKQIAWISLIPHILVLCVILYLFNFLTPENPFLPGALSYYIISIGLRYVVPHNHRKGMKLVKHQKFINAIPLFEKSVSYFTKNNWVDKYRYLTMLTSSKMTYKEMGLCNIAFCFSQIGEGQKAKEYYDQILKEFPKNGIAIAALNLINSIMPEKNID